MDGKKEDPLSPLSALTKYKDLARNPDNHSELIKDKTMIKFLAYVLDSRDEDVLKTSLDTLLLLSETHSNLDGIRSTFGVTEALTALQNNKDVTSSEVREKTSKLLKRLDGTGESGDSGPKSRGKSKKVVTLHVRGLHLETQRELEQVLMKKMKGIHSILVDVEHQKCTLTVYENVDPKNIAVVLAENTDMEAKLISKNNNGQEILVPLLENDKTLDLDDLPPYLDEKDSPVKEKAVRSTKALGITALEWFGTAAGILQRTFYC